MRRLLPVLLAVLAGVMVTSAMKCNKMILERATIGETGMTNDIMEKGRYLVRTVDKFEPEQLILKLNGASDIKTKSRRSFTAILQPSDLKKVTKQHNIVSSI